MNQLNCLRNDYATEAGKDDCQGCSQPYVKGDTALEHKFCQHKLHLKCMFVWLPTDLAEPQPNRVMCLECALDLDPNGDVSGNVD